MRADLTALYKRLPYSVEPMEAWQRPEAYWLATSRAYPDSPGWSEHERREVAGLGERERDLTAAITHAFWNDGAGPERLDARSQL
ncbi:nucleic acid-binding protein [Streptomyces sp. NPDC001220]